MSILQHSVHCIHLQYMQLIEYVCHDVCYLKERAMMFALQIKIPSYDCRVGLRLSKAASSLFRERQKKNFSGRGQRALILIYLL